MTTEHRVQVNVPGNLASKRLKVINPTGEGRRKIQISSNLLPLFGFEANTKVTERSLGLGKGYIIEPAENFPLKNVKKIYSRTYKRRRNNPFETVSETTSKKVLDDSIPLSTLVVHVTLMQDRIIVKPMMNNAFERMSQILNAKDPLTVFAACTSGIDAHASVKAGFKITSLLELRPQESRDKRDLTETGALTALANLEIDNLFNEDIGQVSTEYLAWATKNNPASVFTLSLQCDEFSVAKSKSLKEKSLTDLSSTLDMAYDGLRLIEKLQFPIVLLEQVPGFSSSPIGRMWDLRLRRMGYQTHEALIDARDHDGCTSRKRFFHLATSLPVEFNWPESKERSDKTIFERFIAHRINDFRDITHTSSMKKGIETGRLRIINSESKYAPTILKSQSRQAKDSVVIQKDTGEILFPDLALQQTLMGIPEEFNFNAVNSEQCSEQIGQAVDYPLYNMIMMKIKDHINNFLAVSNSKPAMAC